MNYKNILKLNLKSSHINTVGLKMYFPVAFEKDVLMTPKRIQLRQNEYVLWKSKKGIVCMPNRCPHRNARLSDGRVVLQSKLECPYHGWQFNPIGKCVKIPQLKEGTKIPKACNLKEVNLKVYDEIVWISPSMNGIFKELEMFKQNPNYYVTDYFLDAPYSYELQIENLLDPAHLHFVHDGFQGNRKRASEIFLDKFYENDNEIYGYFIHANEQTPDIEIKFYKPTMIVVAIYDKNTKTLLRKNIIYVSPKEKNTSNVLFRDVAIKELLVPQDSFFLKFHGNLLINGPAKSFVEDHYQFINLQIIDKIMEQDLDILKGQQENIIDYKNAKYVMPAQCDRLIIAFRNWIIKQPHYMTL